MRYWFGGGVADWATQLGAGNAVVFASGVELLCWNAQTGGTQHTDLLDSSGNPVATVDSGDGAVVPVGSVPRFQAPDGVLGLWIGEDGGPRYFMVTTDLSDLLAGKISATGGTMSGELRLLDDSPAASEDYVSDAVAGAGIGGAPSILPFSYEGIVSPSTGTARIYNDTGRTLTIGTVRASVGVAPAGQALIVDVNKNGVSIYTTQANRPQIAAGQVTGTGGAPNVAAWAAGEYLTVDIDQVGTTTPGSGLTVTIPST